MTTPFICRSERGPRAAAGRHRHIAHSCRKQVRAELLECSREALRNLNPVGWVAHEKSARSGSQALLRILRLRRASALTPGGESGVVPRPRGTERGMWPSAARHIGRHLDHVLDLDHVRWCDCECAAFSLVRMRGTGRRQAIKPRE